MPSITPPRRGFTHEEFLARHQAAQAALVRGGFDALLLSTEADFRYFSGFLSPFWQSPTRPWFYLLPAHGKPMAIVPSIGVSALSNTWLDDIIGWRSPNPADEGVSLLADTLRARLGERAQIAVPMGAETHLRMPLNDFHALKQALPDGLFTDDGGLVRQLRQIKSPAEIEKIRWVCQRVSTVFDALPNHLSPTMPLAEVFRQFKIHCLDAGVDDVNYLVGGAQAGGYDDIISPPTTQKLASGDILMLDTGCTYDGYFCDFDRNYALGTPAPEVVDAQHRLWDATEAAFTAIKPGVRCCDVVRIMQETLGVQGSDVGRFGHGLGSQLTETPSFATFETTELRENMVMTLEPSLTFSPGKMLVHEENILVTKHGAQWLTERAPRDMPVVERF